MHNSRPLLYLVLVFVHTHGAKINQCLDYQQTNKENLRNGLFSAGDLCSALEHLLKNRWHDFFDGLQLGIVHNGTEQYLNVKVHTKEARKMATSMDKVNGLIPYMIVPGFVMAGVLPWVIPGIRVVVGAVTMINQMAFTSALFSLIRSYIFDTEREEHIVYVNNGYKKHKHNSHY